MPFKTKPRLPCDVPDCPHLRRAANGDYCQAHLNRLKRTGDVKADVPLARGQGGRVKKGTPLTRPKWAATWCFVCHEWVADMVHAPANPVGA